MVDRKKCISAKTVPDVHMQSNAKRQMEIVRYGSIANSQPCTEKSSQIWKASRERCSGWTVRSRRKEPSALWRMIDGISESYEEGWNRSVWKYFWFLSARISINFTIKRWGLRQPHKPFHHQTYGVRGVIRIFRKFHVLTHKKRTVKKWFLIFFTAPFY